MRKHLARGLRALANLISPISVGEIRVNITADTSGLENGLQEIMARTGGIK